MKSLEIVNERIESTLKAENKLKMELQLCFYKDEAQQIKQDLEVLEILQVLILHNGKSVGYKGIIRDFEVMLRLEKITKEQLDKLKQWLEENENDN